MEIEQICERDNSSKDLSKQLLINSMKVRNISASRHRVIAQTWPNVAGKIEAEHWWYHMMAKW